MNPLVRFVAAGAVACSAVSPVRAQAPAALHDTAFVHLVAALSEAPGFFDTDNLISNEDSYLRVIGALKRAGATGGAYVGVGPDQNFSYIAAVRPHVAFIVDIRRDNLLEHLLFKAVFSLARNRLEYLCLLFGKPAPADTTGWSARAIPVLLAYIDSVRPNTAQASRVRARVLDRITRTGLPLSTTDIATLSRFHATFIASGPGLRFNSFGRAPAPYYPDLRRLLTETDKSGRASSYLAHEADFQVVKSLEDRNLVVPVTGDFSGVKALPAVANWIRTHAETVSAFYTSNVEQYLIRDGGYQQYVQSVARFPQDAHTVMIRSYFQGVHPLAEAGYHAVQLAQLMTKFVANGGYGSYYELATRDILPN